MEPGTLLDVAGAVPESVTARLLDACRSGVFSKVQTAVMDTIADGWGVRLRSSCLHACLRINWVFEQQQACASAVQNHCKDITHAASETHEHMELVRQLCM